MTGNPLRVICWYPNIPAASTLVESPPPIDTKGRTPLDKLVGCEVAFFGVAGGNHIGGFKVKVDFASEAGNGGENIGNKANSEIINDERLCYTPCSLPWKDKFEIGL